jgi:hypothetical protein
VKTTPDPPISTDTKYQFHHAPTPKPFRNVNLLLYKIKVSIPKTHKNLLTLLTLNISCRFKNPHMGPKRLLFSRISTVFYPLKSRKQMSAWFKLA